MNGHGARRIAAATNMLRPEWPLSSILTILERPELAARPARDVMVALAWVACDLTTQTPARVLEAGPWWKATSADGGSSLRPAFDPRLTCAICSEREETCRRLHGPEDHTFRPVDRTRAIESKPAPPAIRDAIHATKGDPTA